eukprot:s1333_g2.t1
MARHGNAQVADLQQTLPIWCARQEPAPALAEAEERLKGALAALATLKATPRSFRDSPWRSPAAEDDRLETPTRRWQRSRKLRVGHGRETPDTLRAVTPSTPSTKKLSWTDSTPMKLTRLQTEELAAAFRALDDLASAADATGRAWPVCKDLAANLRSQAVAKLVQLQQQKEDGVLCSKVVAQVKTDAVEGLKFLQSLSEGEEQRDVQSFKPQEMRSFKPCVASWAPWLETWKTGSVGSVPCRGCAPRGAPGLTSSETSGGEKSAAAPKMGDTPLLIPFGLAGQTLPLIVPSMFRGVFTALWLSLSQAAAASIFSRLTDAMAAMEVLEADDICLPRGVRCALSAIQVRGQRDQDVALLLDDECLFDDHYAMSSVAAALREDRSGSKKNQD